MTTERSKKGAGKWVAKTMDIERPGAPDETIEAIGIYNTETGEFKIVETLGESFDDFIEENPDEDPDELMASYQQEAENWARTHNSSGY